MELEEDENTILDDGFWGSKKKLVLTNKRLIVQKQEGIIRLTWKLENEILLEEVEEAYGMLDVFTSLSSLILKLKNNEQLIFNFRLVDTQMSMFGGDTRFSIPMKTKEITDKYLTEINNQILKNYKK